MNLIDHNVGHAGGEWREGEYGEDVRGEASHKSGKVPRGVAQEQGIDRFH